MLNHAIEFTGEGVQYLSIDERLTIANMTTEWGALTGVFPVDAVTIGWLKKRNDFIKQRGLAGVSSDPAESNVHPRINDNTISDLEKNIPAADEKTLFM